MATAEMETPAAAGMAVVAAPSRSVGLLRPVAPVGEIIQAQEQTREFITRALTPGRDFGVIPGTGDKKNLLKPGAERVCAGFGVRPDFDVVEQEVDHDREVPWKKAKKEWYTENGRRQFKWNETAGHSTGLYRFVVRCTLIHVESGVTVGSGIGSCSTMEGKYVDRPRESENTVLKMAKKRAFVDATLTTFGLSDAFTQDLEDMAEVEEAEVTVERSEPFATVERVKEVRALAVEKGAGKAWLRWYDEKTQEPQPVGWFAAALVDLERKLEEKRTKAAERSAPAGSAEDLRAAAGTAERELEEMATTGGAFADSLPFD